jgi:protein tyrosine phosphatase (PTP) superfamily phosphohydrolase (DUF442 family)
MSCFTRCLVTLLVSSLPVFSGSAPGIKNFDKVDANVYRGGQPTDEGFRYLAKIGVKTIVDLREADGRSKAEKRVVAGAGMKYVNVPMTGLTPPTESDITRILALLEDNANGPVFVHCRRGADRTGAVIAAYHIDYHNWDNARALSDAKAHSMSFFQFPRQNFIRGYRPRTVDAKTTLPSDTAAAAAPELAATPPPVGN